MVVRQGESVSVIEATPADSIDSATAASPEISIYARWEANGLIRDGFTLGDDLFEQPGDLFGRPSASPLFAS